jgi:diguanylate cyclase (GGDEF)-like protein
MKKRIIRLTPLLVAAAVSIFLLAAVLWERSPFLAVALFGPAVALVLYERSIRRGRAAMRLALTDPLTGLGNQRAFRDRVDDELARGLTPERPLALCVLDVDDFKRINDDHGHPAGDRVLREVAGCLRRDGEAFRLGGDEFALVLPNCDAREAAAIAHAVVARLATLQAGDVERISVSAGLAEYPEDGATRDALIERADARLYRAKALGGNRVTGPEEPLAAAENGAS